MKKIICILLIALLAVSVLSGCSGAAANPTPLTPVYANGVSPDYSSDETVDTAVTDEPVVTDENGETVEPTEEPTEPENTIPEGYVTYEDDYISFVHPQNIEFKIDYYLLDAASGAQIHVMAQAVQPTVTDFSRNIFAELSNENFAEMCAEFVADPMSVSDVKISKSTVGDYEITVVMFFEGNTEETTEEVTEEAVGETTEETVDSRMGYAYIYVECSTNPDFEEVIVEISADEYPAEAIPEGYTNLSDIVKNISKSISVVTAE